MTPSTCLTKSLKAGESCLGVTEDSQPDKRNGFLAKDSRQVQQQLGTRICFFELLSFQLASPSVFSWNALLDRTFYLPPPRQQFQFARFSACSWLQVMVTHTWCWSALRGILVPLALLWRGAFRGTLKPTHLQLSSLRLPIGLCFLSITVILLSLPAWCLCTPRLYIQPSFSTTLWEFRKWEMTLASTIYFTPTGAFAPLYSLINFNLCTIPMRLAKYSHLTR